MDPGAYVLSVQIPLPRDQSSIPHLEAYIAKVRALTDAHFASDSAAANEANLAGRPSILLAWDPLCEPDVPGDDNPVHDFIAELLDSTGVAYIMRDVQRCANPVDQHSKLWTFLLSDQCEHLEEAAGVSYTDLCLKAEQQAAAGVFPAGMEVEKDVGRTGFYVDGCASRRAMLSRVLCACAVINPSVGYCQGMNFICAALLQHLAGTPTVTQQGGSLKYPGEERAFWVLALMVGRILPLYHTRTLLGVHADMRALNSMLAVSQPMLQARLEALRVRMPFLATSWFIAAFVTTLPTPLVAKVHCCSGVLVVSKLVVF